jgi:Uma2 family endonuclease
MVMATQPKRIRAEDVPRIPIDDPASTGYELVDGELIAIMGARPGHAWLIIEVGHLLREHVRATGAGAVFADIWCHLSLPYDRERLRAPDVAYFGPEKLPLIRHDEIPRVPPDLAVEIHSPTNYRKRGDFQQRVRDFVEAGVPLLWTIHPDARYAMVYRPDGSARMVREAEVLEGEDILPGFTLEFGRLLNAMP